MYRLSRRSSPGDIHGCVLLPEKVERKVIDHSPIEVLVHVAEAVALLRENKQVETLVGTDEAIDDAEGIARVNVVVDIAVNEHEVALELAGYLGVSLDAVHERSVAFSAYFLLDTVVRFAPSPSVLTSSLTPWCVSLHQRL